MKFNNMILIKTILLQVLFTFATADETVTELPTVSLSPSVSPTISLAPSAAPTVECNAGGSSCAGKVGCRKKRKMQEEVCSYFPSASPSPSSHTSIDDTVGGPANVPSTSVSGQKATKKKRKVKKTKMPKKKKTKVPKAKKTRDPKKKAKKIAIDTNTTEVPIN